MKKQAAFRFSERMIEVLDELITPGQFVRMSGSKTSSKTLWLEYIVANFLMQQLQGKIPDSQLEWCEEPVDVFKLFATYSKAKRKVKGYGFKPDGAAFGPFYFIKKHYVEDE